MLSKAHLLTASLLFCALAAFFADLQPAQAQNIDIDSGSRTCTGAWITADFNVTIDGKHFDLNPSCNFSFSTTLSVRDGLTCEVKSGMCSSFSPQKQIVVSCSDGRTDKTHVACPDEN